MTRWRASGEVEFLGRRDNQVKVRGYRIELGEIEAVVAEHPAVSACVVLPAGQPEELRLVAYVAADTDSVALREHLKARLPAHMIPAAFVRLDALPLTPTGKIDRIALGRRALPAPETKEETYVEPRNEMERRLAAIWREILRVEKPGIHDNFFDLGGHSLLMSRVQSRLEETLERRVPLVEMFEHPTIIALAEHLTRAATPPAAGSPAAGSPARRSSLSRAADRAAKQIAREEDRARAAGRAFRRAMNKLQSDR